MTVDKPRSKKTATAKASPKKAAAKTTARKSEQSIDYAAIGKWSFLIGTAVAILLGVLPPGTVNAEVTQWVVYLLMLLGMVGGVLFFSKAEENSFIILTLGLAFFSNSLGGVPQIGGTLSAMVGALVFFLGFAVIGIVARNIISWFTR